MSVLNFTLYSKSMPGNTHIDVILPIGYEYEDFIKADEKFQTLWLLHGHGATYSEWPALTGIERLAMDHKFAVVCPDAANSFYCAQGDGRDYYKLIVEELPAFLRKWLPLSDKPEDNWIAGYSMGAYGAAKIGFYNPDKYGAIGILSGPRDAAKGLNSINPARRINLEFLFGKQENIKGGVDDIFNSFKVMYESGKKMPMIYCACGTEDRRAHPAFQEFKDYVTSLGAAKDVIFEEAPGVHNWDIWDKFITNFIELCPLKGRNFWRNWYEANDAT